MMADRKPILPRTILACTSIALLGTLGVWYWSEPGALTSSPRWVQKVPASNSAPLGMGTFPASPSSIQVVPAGRVRIRVPILEYHYIRVNPDPRDRLGFNLSVTPANFTAQMDWLATNGYHPINIADLRAYFVSATPLPAKPVVLTFDDGHRDFYTMAFPILQQRRFKAVAYIVPGFFGRIRYMTPAQIVQLDQSGLVEIGSHTVNHVNLVTSNPATRNIELAASKGALESLLEHPVVDFCYPSGDYNSTVAAAVSSAGYLTGTTEVPGTEHSWTDRLTWTRVRVSGGETLGQFAASLGQPEPTVSFSPPPTPIPDASMATRV